jgi:hypothetical protein
MVIIGQSTKMVLCSEEVFRAEDVGIVSKVKIKVIQKMI